MMCPGCYDQGCCAWGWWSVSDPPNPWQCAICHREYPVPSMARDCEATHQKGTTR